ncbi:uncharacterized protein LOC133892193 [Phragmites australis]|uniref:uncharacterized protein LOC133892193 n=1 Tax=Phragmites australis TaxID=29695 RepID=UPI002D788015|nr:uncharacterized protein LOC133892193 [Phragmites australis]
MPTSASELVGELCKFIMSIDHAETLEKEWIRSYESQLISLSLKKIQEIMDVQKPMDKDCFNMGVRMFACDEINLLMDTQYHYMDLQFWLLCDFGRHPKYKRKLDVQLLAKTFDTWPGMVYNISQCKLILLPICQHGHFILFAFDMEARSVSVLDPLPIPDFFKGHELICFYLLRTLKISNKLNLALEVANPPWNDDICSTRGFFVINFMRAWNGKQLQPPICTDVRELRKKFLVDLLKYNGNESKDNIPEVVQKLIKRIR